MHILAMQCLGTYHLLHNHSLRAHSNVIGDCLWKRQLNALWKLTMSLRGFGSDPKMGSAEMLSAFSFSNLRMLSLSFPLRDLRIFTEDSYPLQLLSFTCSKYKAFSSHFGQSECWSVLVYQ